MHEAVRAYKHERGLRGIGVLRYKPARGPHVCKLKHLGRHRPHCRGNPHRRTQAGMQACRRVGRGQAGGAAAEAGRRRPPIATHTTPTRDAARRGAARQHLGDACIYHLTCARSAAPNFGGACRGGASTGRRFDTLPCWARFPQLPPTACRQAPTVRPPTHPNLQPWRRFCAARACRPPHTSYQLSASHLPTQRTPADQQNPPTHPPAHPPTSNS